ncbi:MAG TPA: hypothetical protein VNO32_21575, partial [Candidatus Acidoferrum sp.]|nr:hypothetical protein [Candidatus Acidoferrum sp.]
SARSENDSLGFLFLIEDAIEGIGGEVIKIVPRGRQPVYCPTHVLRSQPGTRMFVYSTAVRIPPKLDRMRTVFDPIRFLLSALRAN